MVRLALVTLDRADVASEVCALALTGRWTSQANAASLDAALARGPTFAAKAPLSQLSLPAPATCVPGRLGASQRDVCWSACLPICYANLYVV